MIPDHVLPFGNGVLVGIMIALLFSLIFEERGK